MADVRQCPQCGAELPASAPEGLCPACLLRQGFAGASSLGAASAPAATSPYSGHRFEAPSIEELAGLFPQLEILELLGQGGMGAVYKARQPRLDRLVAIKILPRDSAGDGSFAERFAREARALARLNHPHIVTVFDFGETGGLFFFVMEYVDGVNLRQMLREGHLSSRQALAIVPQICEALQYAHDEGIVHRDVKPENILVASRGRVKIADFGLAKLMAQGGEDFTLTRTHQVMGTPQYMAPEQIETPQQVDHRADIYALGVVFYEMLTGELPIGRFEPPSHRVQIDVRLDEVVLKSLEKRPERRYQHADEVKTDVESISSTNLPPGFAHAATATASTPDRPPTAPHGTATEAVGRQVRYPALGLIAAGAINCAMPLVVFAIMLFSKTAGLGAIELGLLMFATVFGLVTIYGGAQMLGLRSLAASRTAAIASLVPCSPAFVIGLPMGIWALAVLTRPDVQAAFVPSTKAQRPRSRARLLFTTTLWTAILVGAFAYLGPRIWNDWWPWVFEEHWSVSLEPQSRAYDLQLRMQRRLFHWGQHYDRPIYKRPWVATALIDLPGKPAAATLELDSFLDQWRYAPNVGGTSRSQSAPRPEFVVQLMTTAGVDMNKPGLLEEATALIALVKDAASGKPLGGRDLRDPPAGGTEFGPFMASGGSGGGISIGEGAIGPLDRRVSASLLFAAIWLPGILLLVRRHRRRLSMAHATEQRYRLGTFGFWAALVSFLGVLASSAPWVALSGDGFVQHLSGGFGNWCAAVSLLAFLAVLSVCFLMDYFGAYQPVQPRAVILGGALVVIATAALSWRLAATPATVRVVNTELHGNPQTVALVSAAGYWREYEYLRGSFQEDAIPKTLQQRSLPGLWAAAALGAVLVVMGGVRIVQPRLQNRSHLAKVLSAAAGWQVHRSVGDPGAASATSASSNRATTRALLHLLLGLTCIGAIILTQFMPTRVFNPSSDTPWPNDVLVLMAAAVLWLFWLAAMWLLHRFLRVPAATSAGQTPPGWVVQLASIADFTLGWLLVGASWNAGAAGLAFGIIAMAAITYITLRHALDDMPELRTKIAQQTTLNRALRLGFAFALFVLGLLSLEGAQLGLAAFMSDAFSAAWIAQLPTEATGDAARKAFFLNSLPSLPRENTALLVRANGGMLSVMPGWISLLSLGWIGLLLLLSSVLAAVETHGDRSSRKLGGKLSLAIVGLMITGLIAAHVLRYVQIDGSRISAREFTIKSLARRVNCRVDTADLEKIVDQWSMPNDFRRPHGGYHLGNYRVWDISTDDGATVTGKVRVLQLRPASGFDRWHIGWGPMLQRSPPLDLFCLSMNGQPEAFVWMRASPLVDGTWENETWQATLDSLEQHLPGRYQ